MKNILFVCTGNTCRSPMAEAMLKHIGSEKFNVKSAGVFALKGQSASIHAQQALAEKGISIQHAASPLQEEIVMWADYVLTMTNDHKQAAVHSYPEYKDKVYTLYEFVQKSSKNIADPYGGTLVEYRETLNEIEQLLRELNNSQLPI